MPDLFVQSCWAVELKFRAHLLLKSHKQVVCTNCAQISEIWFNTFYSELEKTLKKHRNYCNKMIKKVVKEKAGKNITNVSSVKQIWSSINDIIKPENLNKHMIRIHKEEKIIEDPLELAETFNVYFKEKVEKLAAGIKREPNFDPFQKLKKKIT